VLAAGSNERQRGEPRNTFAMGTASLFNDVGSEMVYPLLPAFVATVLGAPPVFLGLIEGLAETTASLARLASGVASDKLRRRKPLASAGYLLANALRPVLGLATAWPHVLALRFGDRLGKGVRSAPRDALLADSVPSERRGVAFGWLRALDHAGAVLGPLVALGLLHAGLSLREVFLLSLVPGVLAVVAFGAFVREVRSASAGAGGSGRVRRAGLRRLPRPFLAYCGIVFLFTLGNSSDAFLLLRAQDQGVALLQIPLLWAVFGASKSLASVPGGWLSDRLGRRGMIIAGYAVYAGVYLGFATGPGGAAVWILFVVYGLHFGLVEGVEKAYVADFVPEQLRGSAYGLFNLAIGLGALPASVLFGVIWQTLGAPSAFGFGAGLAAAAAVLLGLLPAERRDQRRQPPLPRRPW
jgi:MFS family permease